MSMSEMASKIEELEIEALKVNSVNTAIFHAIFDGNCAVSNYEWAFVASSDLAHNLHKELEKLRESAFELAKGESK